MFFLSGCGAKDNTSNPNNVMPTYAAHIVNMKVSSGTETASAAPSSAPALISEVASNVITSIQDFHSGDIKWTVSSVGATVQIQNDSNVPINPMIMTYWDPANYPYPSDWSIDQHGVIKDCRSPGAAVQPGEIVTIPMYFGWSSGDFQYAGLLGPQEISLWVYAQPANWDGNCQPNFWDGTLQSMKDYISTHKALAIGTNHFNLVVPSYTDNGNGTILDNVSGRVWQKQDEGTKRTWDDAISYCSSLSLAGTGWRLPTVWELETILDTAYHSPSIDTTYFPGTRSDPYWTSTVEPSGTNKFAFYVRFDFGPINYGEGAGSDLKVNAHYVRCIR